MAAADPCPNPSLEGGKKCSRPALCRRTLWGQVFPVLRVPVIIKCLLCGMLAAGGRRAQEVDPQTVRELQVKAATEPFAGSVFWSR